MWVQSRINTKFDTIGLNGRVMCIFCWCQYFGSKFILVVQLKIYIVKYVTLTKWIDHWPLDRGHSDIDPLDRGHWDIEPISFSCFCLSFFRIFNPVELKKKCTEKVLEFIQLIPITAISCWYITTMFFSQSESGWYLLMWLKNATENKYHCIKWRCQ